MTVDMVNAPERLLRIREAAEILAVSRATVYRLLQDGELEPVRVREHTRIAESDVAGFIQRRREAAP